MLHRTIKTQASQIEAINGKDAHMDTPDYKNMRQMMLSQIATTCRKCGDRYVDTGGQVQCRRPECPIHSVRAQAQAMNTAAFEPRRP